MSPQRPRVHEGGVRPQPVNRWTVLRSVTAAKRPEGLVKLRCRLRSLGAAWSLIDRLGGPEVSLADPKRSEGPPGSLADGEPSDPGLRAAHRRPRGGQRPRVGDAPWTPHRPPTRGGTHAPDPRTCIRGLGRDSCLGDRPATQIAICLCGLPRSGPLVAGSTCNRVRGHIWPRYLAIQSQRRKMATDLLDNSGRTRALTAITYDTRRPASGGTMLRSCSV